MSLDAGTQLGPYEIVGALGAGGMGEVYRARDPRLRREVAVKVLPSSFSADPDRLRRFEQEARATARLNHPNIVAIHDVGEHQGSPYIVSELLEGETLRQHLRSSPMALRRAVEYAQQIAAGLAAAHARGIIHRDLKPDNVFVTRDGRVKILDFGLAKLKEPLNPDDSEASTQLRQTRPGVVMGTIAYMSPEQVRGGEVDHRTDLFAAGVILYEMLSGRSPFLRDSTPETMTAILKDDPPELMRVTTSVPAAVERLVRHSLEKDPGERFQSAKDLGFALQGLTDLTVSGGDARGRRFGAVTRPLTFVVIAGVLAASAYIMKQRAGLSPAVTTPQFQRVTFRRGTVWNARFAPQGGTIVYSAEWEGEPLRTFSTLAGAREWTALPLPEANLLAISGEGELAIALSSQISTFNRAGTLARVSLAGGAPRRVLEQVEFADFSPGGDLSIVREIGAKSRLELPVGTVLFETSGWISHPRISPDGTHVAFMEHPLKDDDRGWVSVVDRQGRVRRLTEEFGSEQGLAWASDDKIWFTAVSSLWSVTMSGQAKQLLRGPQRIKLHDISSSGEALVSTENWQADLMFRTRDAPQERRLSWLDVSLVADLTDDAKQLLIYEAAYVGYLRATDGGPAVKIGDGMAAGLSPDARWALMITPTAPQQIRIMPTGIGEARVLPPGPVAHYFWGNWFPDGRRIVFAGDEPGHASRLYIQDLAGGLPRAISSDGVGLGLFVSRAVSPDGRWIAAQGPDQRFRLYPADGGPPRDVPGLAATDVPIQWSADGKFLFVRTMRGLPEEVARIEIATGNRKSWVRLQPADPAGVVSTLSVQITPDGRAYACTYFRNLSDLFLVSGLP